MPYSIIRDSNVIPKYGHHNITHLFKKLMRLIRHFSNQFEISNWWDKYKDGWSKLVHLCNNSEFFFIFFYYYYLFYLFIWVGLGGGYCYSSISFIHITFLFHFWIQKGVMLIFFRRQNSLVLLCATSSFPCLNMFLFKCFVSWI